MALNMLKNKKQKHPPLIRCLSMEVYNSTYLFLSPKEIKSQIEGFSQWHHGEANQNPECGDYTG